MSRSRDIDIFKKISAGVNYMTTVDHMEEEKIVPTLLTGYNRAVGVGGHPLGCITLVHGPNQVGKSVLALAIAESLRRYGHASFIFDAEFAAEKEWYSAISPLSGFKRVGDLNELEEDIRKMIKNLRSAKEAKKDSISQDIGCVFVIDTITKLMPRDVMEKIEKEGVEKQFPIQAGFVSLWSKWLIPQLFRTGSSAIIVLQEREKIGATKFGKQYKVTLGKPLQYDNRLRCRVEYAKKIEENNRVVGLEAHVAVENNKFVGTTYEKFRLFTSTGRGSIPKGLDLIRDAIEEGRDRNVLAKKSRRGSDVVEATFGGEQLFSIKGGWGDVRDVLIEDKIMFTKFVKMLNMDTVVRKVS